MTAPLLSAPSVDVPSRPSVKALDVLGDTVLRIRSCTGEWFFNVDRSRFCVADHGTDPCFLPPASWKQYAELRLDAEGTGFHVLVDAGGSSGLWGHRHDEGCARC